MLQENYEAMSQEEIKKLQMHRMKKIIKYAYENNQIYQKRFKEKNFEPDDIRIIADIARIPTINKEDLRMAYPDKLLCVDKKKIREVHMSSGSTGTPIIMYYTENDLKQWAECMARCYKMAGAEIGDVIQITPSFGLFNGGFGMYHGAREMGLAIIPTGAGNTARQIKLAKDFNTKIITGVVSYATRIIEELEKEQDALDSLKIGIFGAEILSNSMREKITNNLGIEVFDIYGMTETGGVGTLGQDCKQHDGIHVWEDHYYVEVLNRDSDDNVADGELGELCVTSLTREAMPVIRFRTGDLTKVISREKCACGRTHVKIAPITGRVDDMLIVKGVNIFPKQVENALLEIPGVKTDYQIIIEEINGVIDITINVEAEKHVTGFMVEKHLKERLGFSPKGDVFEPGTLPRNEGKAKRVIDRRCGGK